MPPSRHSLRFRLYCVGLALLLLSPPLASFALGASKTEVELRAQLAASESTLAETRRSAEITKKSLTRLSTQSKKQHLAASEQRSDAADAAEDNASEQRTAHQDDVEQARAEQAKIDTLIRLSENNRYTLYSSIVTSLLGLLGILAGLVYKDRSDKRNHDALTEAANKAYASGQAAYTEANNTSQKIASLGLKIAEEKKA